MFMNRMALCIHASESGARTPRRRSGSIPQAALRAFLHQSLMGGQSTLPRNLQGKSADEAAENQAVNRVQNTPVKQTEKSFRLDALKKLGEYMNLWIIADES
jgi:hypothetical protein